MGLCAACGTPRAETSRLSWDDLALGRHHPVDAPIPNGSLNLAEPAGSRNMNSNAKNQSLERLVAGFRIERAHAYEGGVYGKVGHVTVFAAPISQIPDYDRLYWVMVKVLSEKYGCFIKRKQSSATQVTVDCRDTRKVVFRRNRGQDWIQFYGRQYDKNGNELIVQNRRIIR